MLVTINLMEPDFAQWRSWAAEVRNRYPEGHPIREKAVMLCHAMNAWHTTYLFKRIHPDSAIPMELLDEQIERLVAGLIRLGVAPPTRLKDTKVQKTTKRNGND